MSFFYTHFITIPLSSSVFYCIACIAGILCCFYGCSLLLMIGALLLCGVCFLRAQTKQVRLLLFFLPCFFSLGYYRFHTVHEHYHSTSSALCLIQGPVYATVLAIDKAQKSRFKTRLTLALTSWSSKTQLHPLACTIYVYLFKKPSVVVGDGIRISGLSFKKKKRSTFSWYLFKEDIADTLFIHKMSFKLIKRPSFSFDRWQSDLRNRSLKKVKKTLSATSFSLFSTLFLGTYASSYQIYRPIRSHFLQWGIVHFLARSGLHVVILASLWDKLLRMLSIPFIIRQIALVFFMCLYHLLTWPSISFARAFMTFLLYKSLTISRLTFQPLHILALTTLCILFYNPVQLFFLDFQLSFGLTCALAWFNEIQLQIKRMHPE